MAFAVAAYQLRGASQLPLLAALPAGVLASSLFAGSRATGLRGPGLAAVALAVAAMPGATAPLVGIATGGAESGPDPVAATAPSEVPAPDLWTCLDGGTFDALAVLPAGLVAASSNLGAHILLETPHRVLSAPYHRNEAGLLAQISIRGAGPARAATELRRLGVDYVAICEGDPETTYPVDTPNPGLFPALVRGEVPDFLDPLPRAAGSPLAIYAVRPG